MEFKAIQVEALCFGDLTVKFMKWTSIFCVYLFTSLFWGLWNQPVNRRIVSSKLYDVCQYQKKIKKNEFIWIKKKED